jgi:hypothetical protein
MMKHGCTAVSSGSAPPVYSQHTKDAHGAVLLAAFGSDDDKYLLALRQLATMVHCDLTGELREPHTLVALGKDPRE